MWFSVNRSREKLQWLSKNHASALGPPKLPNYAAVLKKVRYVSKNSRNANMSI
jgi:hypothetical protein